MANKIPVGATIAQTYRFAVANFLNNLGVAWIPLAVLITGGLIIAPAYLRALSGFVQIQPFAGDADALAAANLQNVQTILQIMPFAAVIMLLMIVCLPSAYAAITKEALGTRTGAAYLQFPFGMPMWRLLGATLLFFLILTGAYIGIILAGILLAAVSTLAATASGSSVMVGAIAGTVTFVVMFSAFCALVYGSVIVGFLIAPVTIAEERISLKRGWKLARGNFWRIIGVLTAVFLPLLILNFSYIALVYPDYFSSILSAARGSDAESLQMIRDMAGNATRYWYLNGPMGLLFYVLFIGAYCGASVFSYRALTAGETEPPH